MTFTCSSHDAGNIMTQCKVLNWAYVIGMVVSWGPVANKHVAQLTFFSPDMVACQSHPLSNECKKGYFFGAMVYIIHIWDRYFFSFIMDN